MAAGGTGDTPEAGYEIIGTMTGWMTLNNTMLAGYF